MEYCCSEGILGDKIICDLDKTPDLSQRFPQNCPKCGKPVNGLYCQGCALVRKKFKEDLFTSCVENGILQDSSEPSNDNTNVVNAPREPFVGNQDPGIFCHQCTCELCGNGAHYGYNCPSKVPIVPNPEPFNNQTIKEPPPTVPSFDQTCYSKDGNSFTYDPKSDLVHDSPNIFDPPPQLPFYSYEFCGNDARYGHNCTPQVLFIYPELCYNQDFDFSQDFHDFHQQDLCCENCEKEEEKQIEEDQAANARYWKIPACYDDDDDDYTFAITPNEPDNSLKFISENSDLTIESFSPSPIPVEDNDSLMKEIDLSFTPNYPMPPGIEEDDYESERDILILEEFLSNNSLSLPKNESFHLDIPSSSRPPAKPPDGNTGILNVKVMGDISEQKVPMPRLMITLVSNQEKSPDLLSHIGHEAFQPSVECPMMIHGRNTPILDVPLFNFYPP
uniref:Uncharacterized protein n=1 Tax=Tanacetum cinerariifolium TaxID=118510 RepID=A0A6L2MIP9_TANCI|nr:hypothetical protein [Tanacetum cinerariifolium]